MISFQWARCSIRCNRNKFHNAQLIQRHFHGHRSAVSRGFRDLVSASSSTRQIYVSKSHDPYVNLSIEHYLLQNTSPSSTILFLYINRPCVIIGRNQNPWLEVNLAALTAPFQDTQFSKDEGAKLADIDLVRRRSGGGTVFHDFGNVNYSVICPPATFTRDKHACMVTNAIRKVNPRARVNERHDIVLDQGRLIHPRNQFQTDKERDCHISGYDASGTTPLKVSGSAYKLTRTRALHHGTCLICSPMVGKLSYILQSPAAGYIRARGVDSVRSPVGNVVPEALSPSQQRHAVHNFQQDVISEFCRMYHITLPQEQIDIVLASARDVKSQENSTVSGSLIRAVGDDLGDIEEIANGMHELRSNDWIYGQTPHFSFSAEGTMPQESASEDIWAEESSSMSTFKLELTARNGKILSADIQDSNHKINAEQSLTQTFSQAVVGRRIKDVESWRNHLASTSWSQHTGHMRKAASWLDMAFNHIRTEPIDDR